MKRIIITTLIFALIITGIRLTWISSGWSPAQPMAERGLLDLRGADWSRPILLEGEWLFYPEHLLQRPDNDTPAPQGVTATLPSMWKGHFDDPNRVIGYGSYRLRILLDDASEVRRLSVAMPPAMAASELYVNGVMLGASGVAGRTAAETISSEAPYQVFFESDRSELEIVVHVANFVNGVNGGLPLSIHFGAEDVVMHHKQFSTAMQLLVCIVLFIHMLYAAVLFLMGARQRSLITFILMLACGILSVLVTDDKLLVSWFDLSYDISFGLYTLSYLWAVALLLLFMKQVYPSMHKRPWHLIYGVMVLAITAMVPLLPTAIIAWVDLFSIPMLLAGILYVLVLTLRAALQHDRDAIFLWLAFVGLAANLVWGISASLVQQLRYLYYYPFDFIIASIVFSCYWFRMYFRNLQQTARLAAELRKANKQKNDFLANTSHELRNPLHGMINIAHSVQSQETISADGRAQLDLLMKVGKRMSLLLDDLLDLERLQNKGLRLQSREVQVQAVVDGVIDMMTFMMEGKAIQLRNEIPDSFPPVLADENRLVQILFNLLHNAIKYTTEGRIVIRAVLREGSAVVEVEDTGIGIDPAMLEQMFQPYEQADSSLTAVGGGLGLGLSISRQLAQSLGGSLEAESELGRGSTFRLGLPLAQVQVGPVQAASDETEAWGAGADPYAKVVPDEVSANHLPTETPSSAMHAEERQPSDMQSPPTRPLQARPSDAAGDAEADKPRVLIVDDDPVNLNILTGMLPKNRYHIVGVNSAREAMKLIDEVEWDLVVSDVMMPRMSGYELTRAIRRRFTMSELPVLLLTARSHPEDIAAGFQAGANDYVTKPADSQEMQYRVQALTELKQTTAERLRLEAALLQAQVQPHFLFNTLNSIAALSAIDQGRMSSLLSVFGQYLKASFNFRNTERLVPLEQELALVKAYLFIERERFGDRLNVQWDVPNRLISTMVPPLSIQTLVENSVRHGIMQRNRGGTVRIAAVEQDDYVEIEVSDDGVGIKEHTLQQVLQDMPTKKGGIGLRNTNRRLRQIYGAGLNIESKVEQGTRITFRARQRWK